MPLFLAPVETRLRFNVRLQPAPDGTNRTFTVGEEFLSDELELFHNGRRLVQIQSGSIPNPGDFYVFESGGPGTGFDTLVLFFTPVTTSELRANYFVP